MYQCRGTDNRPALHRPPFVAALVVCGAIRPEDPWGSEKGPFSFGNPRKREARESGARNAETETNVRTYVRRG